MITDEQVLELFKKYLHFNSKEDIEEFHRTFFDWLTGYGKEMVGIGLKNGFEGGVETCINTIRELDKTTEIYNLKDLAKMFEDVIKKD